MTPTEYREALAAVHRSLAALRAEVLDLRREVERVRAESAGLRQMIRSALATPRV